jgi:hypothetical protein
MGNTTLSLYGSLLVHKTYAMGRFRPIGSVLPPIHVGGAPEKDLTLGRRAEAR